MTWKECTNIKQGKKYQSWGLNWVIIGASILNKTEYLSRCANWFPEFENLKLSSASLKFKKILGGTYALHGYSTWRHLFWTWSEPPTSQKCYTNYPLFFTLHLWLPVLAAYLICDYFFSGLVIKNCAKVISLFEFQNVWISFYMERFCCHRRLSHPLWTCWCMYVLAGSS